MKILRMVISLATLAALVLGGVYVYRGCSDGTFKLSAMPVYASSAETNDSPIVDLQRDPDFKISDYPYAEEDKSLQVLQIAENKDGGLYVYVYHPSGAEDKRARALHMNMSVTRVSDQPTGYNLYALDFASGDKTIGKYTVKDFKVKSDVVRHYDIASVTRSFIAGVDEEPGGDNTITEKAFPVGQSWTVAGIGDAVEYAMVKRDVVEVTSKYVGFNSYRKSETISYFIAFSTDRPFDTLFEVEIAYAKQEVTTEAARSGSLFLGTMSYKGAEIDTVSIINADHKEVVNTPNGKKTLYTWDSILTSDVFYAKEKTLIKDNYTWNDTGYNESKVLEQSHVVRFFSCAYSTLPGDFGGYGGAIWTRVFDTCILRLKYEENGKVYDVGVVDDVQSGVQPGASVKPVFVGRSFLDFLRKIGRALKKAFAKIWKFFSAPFKFVFKYWKVFLIIGIVLLALGVVIPYHEHQLSLQGHLL